MQVAADLTDASTAIQTDLPAIFVSLELSRSTWLITSLSPGAGEKMSKHSIRAGDVAGLLMRLAQLKEKARGRTGRDFPIIAIQEAGLDGFSHVPNVCQCSDTANAISEFPWGGANSWRRLIA